MPLKTIQPRLLDQYRNWLHILLVFKSNETTDKNLVPDSCDLAVVTGDSFKLKTLLRWAERGLPEDRTSFEYFLQVKNVASLFLSGG